MYVFHLQARITTRLQQYRAKAELSRNTRPQAWVPREKLPRPLTSSASAIRKLMRKAELMGISTDIFPVDTSDANASMDGRRKHKQPALTADFVNYYLGGQTHILPAPVTADVFFPPLILLFRILNKVNHLVTVVTGMHVHE